MDFLEMSRFFWTFLDSLGLGRGGALTSRYLAFLNARFPGFRDSYEVLGQSWTLRDFLDCS